MTAKLNMKKFQQALTELEQLHWHLHLNGGPDLWTADLLRKFQEAVQSEEEEEAPQSAA